MRFFCSLILATLPFALVGCPFPAASPPVEEVSEVSLRKQTGLLGVTFTIAFRRDATASGECTFYNLDEKKKTEKH